MYANEDIHNQWKLPSNSTSMSFGALSISLVIIVHTNVELSNMIIVKCFDTEVPDECEIRLTM